MTMKKAIVLLLALCCLTCALPARAELVPLGLDEMAHEPYEACFTSPTHYEDPSITVDIYPENRIFGTNYVYAVIKIADASQLRTAFSYKYGKDHEVPGTVMAAANHAVFAINADFYSFYHDGFLVRQGKEYRNRPIKDWDVLIIDQYGDFHVIVEPGPKRVAAWKEDHPDLQIINTFNFGPALAENGVWLHEKIKGESDVLNYFQIAGHRQYARMAVCQLAPLTYVFACCESVLDVESEGLTLDEWAQCLREIDDKIADYDMQVVYNIDGGGSATMVFHNEKINSLTNPKIRNLVDILYFVSAWNE